MEMEAASEEIRTGARLPSSSAPLKCETFPQGRVVHLSFFMFCYLCICHFSYESQEMGQLAQQSKFKVILHFFECHFNTLPFSKNI